MSDRDEFSAPTKRALAERSGFRCSYLGCSNATIGPSEESETAVARTGVACHITAAAPGGKRYDPTLSPTERSSISNGIWMCQTHSVEIDRDEARYTSTLLNHWKNISESRADYAKNHGWDIFDKYPFLHIDSLANIDLALTKSPSSNSLIGNAITDSCLPQLWGKEQSVIIRDLIIELYRNAFDHGEASSFEISISEQKLEIVYDGKKFDIFQLLDHQNANGGADTLQEIVEKYGSNFVVNYSHEGNNKIIIHRLSDFYALAPSLPCVISLSEYDDKALELDLAIYERCGALYIILPLHFCRSDVRGLESQLAAFEPNGKPVYIVGSDVAEPTRKAIIDRLPNFTFVQKQC
ncbi:hypothetical protein [Aquipseudomonas alcaligenes]|uniref:hypothetical protein n=1 Tax=Aquipseudomonas alcaligenes TaxID=43263 RepID=UPI000A870189|nr:hypothetical protein [Pseudomonas alcaligenes]